jgi:hypothetical protein
MDRRGFLKRLLGLAAFAAMPKLSRVLDKADAEDTSEVGKEELEVVENDPNAFDPVWDNSTDHWVPYFTTTTSRASWSTGASCSLHIAPVTSASGVIVMEGMSYDRLE